MKLIHDLIYRTKIFFKRFDSINYSKMIEKISILSMNCDFPSLPNTLYFFLQFFYLLISYL